MLLINQQQRFEYKNCSLLPQLNKKLARSSSNIKSNLPDHLDTCASLSLCNMHFQYSLLALATAIGFAPSVYAASVPDGSYIVTNLEDGSTLWTPVDNKTLEPIKVQPEVKRSTLNTRSAKFVKRRTDCWGNALDHAGVDTAANALRGWANTGTTLTSGDGPRSFGYVSNGAYVYYCITRARTSGNLDIGDVNYALGQMDAKCALYSASWFGWDGSSEIVGKASTSQQVCTGPF